LLGDRVSLGLKVFLLALAIVGDLGAVLVVALFYTEDLQNGPLLISLLVWGVLRAYPGGVPRAIRLAADAPRLLGPPHRRLAHPEVPGEFPITGRAHPYTGPEVKP
jgi:hypothetical protein